MACVRIALGTLRAQTPTVNVLMSLDTDNVHPGTQQGLNPNGPYRVDFQPVASTKTVRGAGRIFYTNLGHTGYTWAQEEFRRMMLQGNSVGHRGREAARPRTREGPPPGTGHGA